MKNDDSNLLAILGPTNTGKTYLAFERLVSYKTGIFGFPLRLLARENYDKALEKLGSEKVALITGEEKILPSNPCYYFCTVESMPENIQVECVAIDEVQLASDYERGHIFTDRILNLRGVYETIFLGSLTIEKILLRLFPKINIEKRNRFSKLSFSPKKTLSKLIPRSAVIAFNINSVYEIAETLRVHKGGAAVVLGSLSPRTRNSQVEVYEEKKVDYLVATDAIGMGLNLNINHISFSSLQKFDGKYTRDLSASELGQIAGRAGRYLNDGTFGYLKDAGKLDPLIIKSVEDHNFNNIQRIYWRNSNINFDNIDSVLSSLNQFPVKNFFIHKKNAEDEINFRTLLRDQDILPHLKDSNYVRLLWDVCRIPDFQKIFNDSYIFLLKNVFLTLIINNGVLNEAWLREKILKFENYAGGIEELSIKIENIRTWTYIANQSSWIKDFEFWQKKTQEIENNLSDRLHDSLTSRFVDFSASFFLYNKSIGEEVKVKVDKNNNIKLNGQNYGYINGFDLEINIEKSKSLFSLNHVKKSIRSMIEEKINNFLKAPLDSFNLGGIDKIKISDEVKIYWGDEPIGIVVRGNNIFSPVAETINTEFLESDKKILVTKKLQEWLDETISINHKLLKSKIDENISSELRSIIFNVYNNLGTLLINDYYENIKKFTEQDKANISRAGIRIGAKFFFMPNLLKKFPMELNAFLWKIFNKANESQLYPLPKDGRVSFTTSVIMPESYWSAIGYVCINKFALRADVFERVFFLARQKIKYGPFIESSDMMNPAGCNSEQLSNILKYCGLDNIVIGNKRLFFSNPNKKLVNNKIKIKNKKAKTDKKFKENKPSSNTNNSKLIKKEKQKDPNSPFAVLQKLL